VNGAGGRWWRGDVVRAQPSLLHNCSKAVHIVVRRYCSEHCDAFMSELSGASECIRVLGHAAFQPIMMGAAKCPAGD
jgi:hypothetical protein